MTPDEEATVEDRETWNRLIAEVAFFNLKNIKWNDSVVTDPELVNADPGRKYVSTSISIGCTAVLVADGESKRWPVRLRSCTVHPRNAVGLDASK